MFRFCWCVVTLHLSVTLLPGNVFTVGPSGAHATVQAALDAAAALGGDHEIRI